MNIEQYCVSEEKQFRIALLVMCEVAVRNKSAQIVTPNVC